MSFNSDNNQERRGQNDASGIHLPKGQLRIQKREGAISTVVGDGLVVIFWSKTCDTYAVAHFMWPNTYDPTKSTPRYGNVALPFILKKLEDSPEFNSLEVHLIGGASIVEENHTIGIKNIEIARKIIGKYGLAISSEDCGGIKGRKVVFNSDSGEILTIKTDRIRESDWSRE